MFDYSFWRCIISPIPTYLREKYVMVPNEPGFEETETLGSNPSVDASLESNPSEATTTAAETQATDVSEPAAAADIPVSEPVAAPASGASSTLKRGDLVEGTIISTSPTLV